MRGIIPNMMSKNTAKETPSVTQNSCVIFPCEAPVITAKIIKTAVSVNIVPPIVMATASFLDIPYLLKKPKYVSQTYLQSIYLAENCILEYKSKQETQLLLE